MACSICSQIGHNSKTCPHLQLSENISTEDQNNDYAVWIRYRGMSKQQAKEFRRRTEDLLDEVAPDADGITAWAKERELPDRIRKAMDATSRSEQKKLDS
jgi:hypothetical protein